MEMRRIDPRNFPLARWSKVAEFYRRHHWARWLCGYISVTYLYRLLSRYGSRYARALAWLFGLVFLVFPLLFASFGLRSGEFSLSEAARGESSRSSVPTPPISWSNALRAKPRGRELWRTYVGAMWASVEVSSFQRRLTIEPSDNRGRRTAVIEAIVIPGQLALFLLALRRRFRR